MAKKKKDMINSPSHYTEGGLEVFDILAAKMTPEELSGFCKGNVLKYVLRESLKGGAEDLKKSKWYLEKLIKLREAE